MQSAQRNRTARQTKDAANNAVGHGNIFNNGETAAPEGTIKGIPLTVALDPAAAGHIERDFVIFHPFTDLQVQLQEPARGLFFEIEGGVDTLSLPAGTFDFFYGDPFDEMNRIGKQRPDFLWRGKNVTGFFYFQINSSLGYFHHMFNIGE